VDAPGVYVAGAKVAALGLRVRNGCCFHGLSLNVDMDLSPFRSIDPCGYPGLQVTQLHDLGIDERTETVADKLLAKLANEF
jgi:lipoyl(octanoyl) transferase